MNDAGGRFEIRHMTRRRAEVAVITSLLRTWTRGATLMLIEMLASDRLSIWPCFSADDATGTLPTAAAINAQISRRFMRVHLSQRLARVILRPKVNSFPES